MDELDMETTMHSSLLFKQGESPVGRSLRRFRWETGRISPVWLAIGTRS